ARDFLKEIGSTGKIRRKRNQFRFEPRLQSLNPLLFGFLVVPLEINNRRQESALELFPFKERRKRAPVRYTFHFKIKNAGVESGKVVELVDDFRFIEVTSADIDHHHFAFTGEPRDR